MKLTWWCHEDSIQCECHVRLTVNDCGQLVSVVGSLRWTDCGLKWVDLLWSVFLLLTSWSAAFCHRLHFVYNKLTLIGVCVCVAKCQRYTERMMPFICLQTVLGNLLGQKVTTRCVCVYKYVSLSLSESISSNTHTCAVQCKSQRPACFVTLKFANCVFSFAEPCLKFI